MPRPRKPTHLKLVTGTYRKHRENPAEPKLAPGIPPPPAHLTSGERAAWKKFGAALTKMRVGSPEDFAAMEMLACAYAEAHEHRAYLREHGRTYETQTESGGTMIRARPEVAMLRAADRLVLVLLGRFGLTPSERSGVSARPDASADADDEFT